MSETKYQNSGTMGRNKRRREGTKDPEFSGSINVDGVDYWLSGWVKDGNDGSKFFSLSVKPKDAPKSKPAEPTADDPAKDDDVPF